MSSVPKMLPFGRGNAEVEARRLTNLRAANAVSHTPEMRARLSAVLRAKWASGTRKTTCRAAYVKISRKMKEAYRTGERKPPNYSPAELERIGKGVSKAHRAKGESHEAAGPWRLRSPENVVFEFKNLCAFVRDNENLFSPEDVQWRKSKSNHAMRCRATGGLAMLSIRKKHPLGSWKGWTWHSQVERMRNKRRDLLERK